MVVALLVALATTATSAHYKFRIVGTVTKITAEEIAVKQIKDGVVVEMDHDKKTKITRDNQPVGRDQIKVGSSVVIDALGDDIFDLTATEIRRVPAIPAVISARVLPQPATAWSSSPAAHVSPRSASTACAWKARAAIAFE